MSMKLNKVNHLIIGLNLIYINYTISNSNAVEISLKLAIFNENKETDVIKNCVLDVVY